MTSQHKALNLNIHGHALLPDGVFLEIDEGYLFRQQSAPTHEEFSWRQKYARTSSLH